MEITETYLPKSREKWRKWLERNHRIKGEIWVIFFKKHTGKAKITYDETVEEALCFGWIDGIMKRLDEERYTVRFTPRRKGSIWSEVNIRRVEKMISEGKMTETGKKAFDEMDPAKIDPSLSISGNELEVPDFVREIFEERNVMERFGSIAPSHRKRYLYWITTAKKEETRLRRAKKAVDMLIEERNPGWD
jgi:uncharacterized protein YdeI (YjbR/CyaY-like superfamily)